MSPLHRLRSKFCIVLIAMSTTQIAALAGAQSILVEPDFSGMRAPGGYVSSVARDSERGWNYVGGTYLRYVGGVATSGPISRVNDAGFVDQNWRTTDSFRD